MNKYIVYLGNTRCEGIIDVTSYEDMFLVSELLSDKSETTPELGKIVRSIKSMKLRCRFNSHREIEAFIWETEYDKNELWDALELEGEYAQLIKTTAKPY